MEYDFTTDPQMQKNTAYVLKTFVCIHCYNNIIWSETTANYVVKW